MIPGTPLRVLLLLVPDRGIAHGISVARSPLRDPSCSAMSDWGETAGNYRSSADPDTETGLSPGYSRDLAIPGQPSRGLVTSRTGRNCWLTFGHASLGRPWGGAVVLRPRPTTNRRGDPWHGMRSHQSARCSSGLGWHLRKTRTRSAQQQLQELTSLSVAQMRASKAVSNLPSKKMVTHGPCVTAWEVTVRPVASFSLEGSRAAPCR